MTTAAPARAPGPSVSGDDVLGIEPITAGAPSEPPRALTEAGTIGGSLPPGSYELPPGPDGKTRRHHVVGDNFKDLQGDPGKLDNFAENYGKAKESDGWLMLYEDVQRNSPTVRHMAKNVPGGVLYVVHTFWKSNAAIASSAAPVFMPGLGVDDKRQIVPIDSLAQAKTSKR